MTLDELRAYRSTLSNMKALEEEINSLYSPISSPTGHAMSGASGSEPGDPTAKAVHRILALKEKLEAEREKMNAQLVRIETWIAEVDDAEISAIVRWHFIVGRSWAETTQEVYGYRSEYSKRRFYRFFRKDDPVVPESTRL